MLKRNIIKEKIENMSARIILYFIGEINKIQDILNRSVIPNNIGYVVSRYFIFIIITSRMLTIRLSRHGRSKRPFFRIVLTEHTKPAKFGYKEVLGSYDPLNHILQADVETIKAWVEKGSQMSERVAKLLFKQTNDAFFQKFFEQRERKALPKNEK